jgi:hypothetical protein
MFVKEGIVRHGGRRGVGVSGTTWRGRCRRKGGALSVLL